MSTLCIYDFDNTFVRSPDEELAKEVHPDYCEIKDWWKSFASLDPYYFYFPLIPEIYQDFINHQHSCFCILITKRDEYLLDNIKTILNSKSIQFDNYFATNHQSKINTLEYCINYYQPTHIRIFDDSYQNIEEYYYYCYNQLPNSIEVDIFYLDHNSNKIYTPEK